MPSVVAICNVGLSHIGDVANVTSIDPPDGSAQAGYCKTFYPIALAALLDMAEWSFATVRVALAQVDNPSSTWAFAYKSPSDVVSTLAVLPSDALDDYSQNFSMQGSNGTFANGGDTFADFADPSANLYTPQPYALEINAAGDQLILTNTEDAVLRYVQMVNDPTKFPPLFVLALSYLLASMLAGPIIKGEAGANMATSMLKMFGMFKAQSTASDANQGRIVIKQSVPWMAGR